MKNKEKLKNWVKIKVKENMILTLKSMTDYKYWKSVYPEAAIVLQ